MCNAADIGKTILRPITITKVSILVLVFSLFSTGWAKGDTIKSLSNNGGIHSDIYSDNYDFTREDKPPPYLLREETNKRPIGESEEFDYENQDVIPQKEKKYDIPIVVNESVENFIHYFQTSRKKVFSRWLATSYKYVPMMKEIFRKNSLPEDLVYMAMIESGFNPKAYSRAHASGPWQFIKGTGQRYGMRVDRWIDERRDPEKATIAAARYLKDLYDMFGCWYLAAAAYNAGENKIAQAIEIYNTRDFWEIAKHPYLARETKDYVPQLIASVIIAKNPEKYGFDDIDYKLPFTYNKVQIPDTTNLKVIAKVCKTDYDTIKTLNPELKKGYTPPNYPDYEVKVPIGRKEIFAKNFAKTEPSERSAFIRHIIKRGETLSRIASLYDTGTKPIMQLNNIKNPRGIKAGRALIIPVGSSKIAKRDTDKKRGFILSKVAKKEYLNHERKEIIYTVRKGDTLWNIAQRYDLKTSEIRDWNKMGIKDTIHTGTTLRLMVKSDLNT